MTAIRLVVGVWLCAAPWARAQRAAAPALRLSAPPMTAPAALPAPALMAPAATLAPAPVPLKLAAVDSALAQFAQIDLKSAPADDLRGGADALMARALGARAAGGSSASDGPEPALGAPSGAETALQPSAPGPARAPAASPRVHLLSKPLHETVELGPLARVLHYVLETGFQFIQAGLAWQVTGSPAAGLAVLAFELIKVPPMITAQSLADLGLRYWWRKLATLRRLADTPGVTRIRVLTTGEARFSGLLAWHRENSGLVFLDASGPLPAAIRDFGLPIEVADLAGRSVRLVLRHGGVAEHVHWTPTLAELLAGTPIPARVAEAWRAQLDADAKDKPPLRRVFDFGQEKDLRVEAHLSDGAGGESPLGAIAFGRSVKRLVGLGRLDRVGALLGRAPTARAIPLSDTTVERGGERTVKGAARRAWRRLTGTLIVR